MNPEFQRNLWLEASPRRIGWVAVVLVLVYGAAMVSAGDRAGPAVMAAVGGAVFFACALVWGGRAAGFSVLTEIAERTWDFQRLSALTPWQMTWGKLLGATALASAAGLTGLVVLALTAPRTEHINLPVVIASAVAGAALLQAASLGAALIGVRKARAEGRIAHARGVLFGFFAGAFLLGNTLLRDRWGGLFGDAMPGADTKIWWGMNFDGDVLALIWLTVFAVWAVVGAWRLMRLELQLENSPVVWVAFLLFFAVWSAGFASHGGAWTAAVLALAGATYAAAFTDPADKVRVRRFGGAVLHGRGGRLMVGIPAAVPAAVLAVVTALLALVLARKGGLGAVALVAFMLRDLGLIAFFRFGPRPRRGDFAAIIALALAYGVGAIFGNTFGGEMGLALFLPTGEKTVTAIVSGLVQAAVVWAFALRRIRHTDEAPA